MSYGSDGEDGPNLIWSAAEQQAIGRTMQEMYPDVTVMRMVEPNGDETYTFKERYTYDPKTGHYTMVPPSDTDLASKCEAALAASERILRQFSGG